MGWVSSKKKRDLIFVYFKPSKLPKGKKGRKKKSLVSLILVCDWMEFELQTAIPIPWRQSKRNQNGALLYDPKES